MIAAIFWLKTRAGWKETSVHEVSGRDGGPIETSVPDRRELAKGIVLALAKAVTQGDPPEPVLGRLLPPAS